MTAGMRLFITQVSVSLLSYFSSPLPFSKICHWSLSYNSLCNVLLRFIKPTDAHVNKQKITYFKNRYILVVHSYHYADFLFLCYYILYLPLIDIIMIRNIFFLFLINIYTHIYCGHATDTEICF